MSIYDSTLWINDIEKIISDFPELNALSDQRILITGASGLICSSIVDILILYNERYHKNIQIFVAGRDEKKMRKRFGSYFDRNYFHFASFDSNEDNCNLNISCDFVIHGASHSSPKDIMQEPVETILGNFCGAKNLLDYSQKNNVKRFLFISSSEIYGKSDKNGFYSEIDYGAVDSLNTRNSYSIGKLATENLCYSYYRENGVNIVIARPGHIYGPAAKKTDSHVSSMWAFDAALGKDIVMKSSGEQIRSYVYCLDCACAILKVLVDGETGQAYNIANPNSVISIREMADIICESGGVRLLKANSNEVDRNGFNPMMNSSLDATKLFALGWKSHFDAKVGFCHTVEILKETLKDLENEI